MNSLPKSPDTERNEAHTECAERPCKIVVFWEDFDAAIHARKAFDSIVQCVGAGREVEASSWSFSMLGSTKFNAAVLMDASRADVIVVAARGDQEIPGRVATWLELSVMRNEEDAPVLIALHDEGLDAHNEAAPLCTSLQKIAARQGARFACSQDLEGFRSDSFSGQPVSLRASRAIQSHEPTLVPYAATQRWCGINE